MKYTPKQEPMTTGKRESLRPKQGRASVSRRNKVVSEAGSIAPFQISQRHLNTPQKRKSNQIPDRLGDSKPQQPTNDRVISSRRSSIFKPEDQQSDEHQYEHYECVKEVDPCCCCHVCPGGGPRLQTNCVVVSIALMLSGILALQFLITTKSHTCECDIIETNVCEKLNGFAEGEQYTGFAASILLVSSGFVLLVGVFMRITERFTNASKWLVVASSGLIITGSVFYTAELWLHLELVRGGRFSHSDCEERDSTPSVNSSTMTTTTNVETFETTDVVADRTRMIEYNNTTTSISIVTIVSKQHPSAPKEKISSTTFRISLFLRTEMVLILQLVLWNIIHMYFALCAYGLFTQIQSGKLGRVIDAESEHGEFDSEEQDFCLLTSAPTRPKFVQQGNSRTGSFDTDINADFDSSISSEPSNFRISTYKY